VQLKEKHLLSLPQREDEMKEKRKLQTEHQNMMVDQKLHTSALEVSQGTSRTWRASTTVTE
jgi:hypothetical protein